VISDKLFDGLNAQVNKEMASAYIYMAMSAQCSDMNWPGAASWFMAQYHEEMFHAMKFYNYLLDQGRKPILKAIAAPQADYPSLKAMYEATYAHEQTVTASIRALMKQAKAEDDYATEGFLAWYVKEQVEEEKNDTEILAQLTKIGDSQNGLFMLDHQLGKRKATVPTDFNNLGGED
jgi:ferritin